jgi:hypothetical protein
MREQSSLPNVLFRGKYLVVDANVAERGVEKPNDVDGVATHVDWHVYGHLNQVATQDSR